MDETMEMMKFLDLNDIDDLFKDIPEDVRINKLNIPEGIDEHTLRIEVRNILSKNKSVFDMPNFLGAGVYNHYIPAGVFAIASRSEFYTVAEKKCSMELC